MARFGVDAIRGIVPPIATPINKDETVDEQGMRRLVDFQLGQGANAIFVMGGTGEFFCFPDGEKRRAIETVVDQVAGRAPVIAGITDLSTRRAVANAHVAQEAGADFLTSLPPFFFALQQRLAPQLLHVRSRRDRPAAAALQHPQPDTHEYPAPDGQEP